MTIGDRIFERLGEIGMTQKEFSEKTGISQSTISEWKSKRTNPTSEKIMIICDTLNVTPEWILSGSSKTGNRGNELPWYVIDRSTELGRLVSQYRELDEKQRARVMGYLQAEKAGSMIADLVDTKRVLEMFRRDPREQYRMFVEGKISHAEQEMLIMKDMKENELWPPW